MKRYIRHYLKSHSLHAQFMRFATVGAKISLIDAGLLYLQTHMFGTVVYIARIFSLGTAMTLGYLLHRYFTFGGDERGCFYRQMAGHYSIHLTGAMINYGTFSLLVMFGHDWLEKGWLLNAWPLVALYIGGFIGMLFNFTFSKKLVFRRRAGTTGAIS